MAFVTDPDIVDPGHFERRHGFTVTRVGHVSEGEGVWLRDAAGNEVRAERGGYDHWSEGGP